MLPMNHWSEVVYLQKQGHYAMLLSRPEAEVLGTRVFTYMFEVLVLMEIMGHVFILMLNVLRFYKHI